MHLITEDYMFLVCAAPDYKMKDVLMRTISEAKAAVSKVIDSLKI